MSTWLAENWYVIWGIAGTVLVLALNLYARRYPETLFASHWDRLKYAVFACAPVAGVFILLNAGLELWAPNYSMGDYFFSPDFALLLLAACWIAAPGLKRLFPLERGSR